MGRNQDSTTARSTRYLPTDSFWFSLHHNQNPNTGVITSWDFEHDRTFHQLYQKPSGCCLYNLCRVLIALEMHKQNSGSVCAHACAFLTQPLPPSIPPVPPVPLSPCFPPSVCPSLPSLPSLSSLPASLLPPFLRHALANKSAGHLTIEFSNTV